MEKPWSGVAARVLEEQEKHVCHWKVLLSQKRTVASSKMQVVRRRRRPFSKRLRSKLVTNIQEESIEILSGVQMTECCVLKNYRTLSRDVMFSVSPPGC